MVLTIKKKTMFIMAVRIVMSVAAYEFMLQRAHNLICTKMLLTLNINNCSRSTIRKYFSQ